jgi:purine-binding chemotaxis protein CheW
LCNSFARPTHWTSPLYFFLDLLNVMQIRTELVVFRIDEQRYALPLEKVERIVRAAQVTRLPKAPENVVGVIDVQGRIVPVLDIRRRFQLEPRPITTADHFLIANTSRRNVILVIDEAVGLTKTLGEPAIVPEADQIKGAITLDDGLLLIQDLERFLSPEDESALDKALQEGTLDET